MTDRQPASHGARASHRVTAAALVALLPGAVQAAPATQTAPATQAAPARQSTPPAQAAPKPVPSGQTAPAAKPGSAAKAQCQPGQFRVLLDVGHTDDKFGATSARGGREYDFNLTLAKEIDRELKRAGFERTQLMIIKGRTQAGLHKRAKRANTLPADLLLSVHHDSVPDNLLETWEYEGVQRGYSDRFRGHSLFVSIDNGDYAGSLAFGRLLGMRLKAHGLKYTPHYTDPIMGSRQRILVDPEAGVYRYDQLIVLKETRVPAVLMEAGSIINRDEELLLGKPEHRALISASVVEAVKAFCAQRAPRAKPPATAQAPKQAPVQPPETTATSGGAMQESESASAKTQARPKPATRP